MKIVYLHGFNSAGDPTSDKVIALGKLGEVICPTYNTLAAPSKIENFLNSVVVEHDPTIIVGCSLGGYWANRIAYTHFKLAVMLNPSIEPNINLMRAIGENVNFKNGEKGILTKNVVEQYNSMLNYNSNGLVFIDKGDELLDPIKSIQVLSTRFQVKAFEGGSHRFEHTEEILSIIDEALIAQQFVGRLS